MRISKTGHHRACGAVATATAMLVLTAACSSAASGGGSSDLAGVAKAKAFVQQHLPYPDSIGVSAPLSKKPPTGKTIAVISGQTTSSKTYNTAFQTAGKKLGWTIKVISMASDTPDNAVKAMNLAVQMKPDAVFDPVFPAATFPTQIAQLKAAGIPYIEAGQTDKPGNGVNVVITTGADYAQRGQWLANWAVADSDGKANVAVFNLSTYPVLNAVLSGWDTTLKSLCPTCSTDTQNVVATSIGSTLPGEIVNYLNAHPQVNYVMATYGDMTIGLAQALSNAGLSDRVKVITQSGGPQNFQALVDGTEKANVPQSDPIIAWMAVDAIARTFVGDKVDQKDYDYVPRNIVTKDNVKDPSVPYVSVADYQQQYLKLWHVG